MPSKPRPLLLSCGILRKEIEKLIQEKKLDVEAVFLDAGLHVVYAELEKEITAALEEHSKHAKNGIIVLYGDMCHPRIKKIVKQYPNTIKIDALNCIDCLLGGHKNLLHADPKGCHFFLSPGWMPCNLKKNKYFREIFDWNMEGVKEMFEHLNGIIVIDSLGNLDDLKSDIEEFSTQTGLQVRNIKSVGLDGLKALLDEAIIKLQGSPKLE
ncbi:MAG: hypothetical protein CW691_08965 [Candidatus Bathyarchaeum sp.]|nr:MAG: hypothetical protein CW691_08965 [Candidatus Bathyarchaeum sp.]